jgi:sucrose phosphorylase
MIKNKVQLVTYPDSMGGNLKHLHDNLRHYFNGCFEGIHLLPPYPSSGDRGFAPIDYFQIDAKFGSWEDIQKLGEQYQIMVDLMVNHISQKSLYFQDFLKHPETSKYKNYFIQLENIWEHGLPRKEDIDKIFLRREKPYSTFQTNNKEVKVWTTFGKTDPSEQIDLDITHKDVRNYFRKIFTHFQKQNIQCIRLDAIGYVIKKLGSSCFFVEPDIYEFINWMYKEADERGLDILPEVHAHYAYQEKLADKGYWIYDFILPFTILEAIINRESDRLIDYLRKRPSKQITMLDCHDGIPLLPDLVDKIDVQRTKALVKHCEKQGANISRIINDEHKYHGIDVHQINCTYYDALERQDDQYILARALQLFTPGVPQIYYVGLLAGENDYVSVEKTGDGRAINRHNYTEEEIREKVELPVVKRMMHLIQFRNKHKAFQGTFSVHERNEELFSMRYEDENSYVQLNVNLKKNRFDIESFEDGELQKFKP